MCASISVVAYNVNAVTAPISSCLPPSLLYIHSHASGSTNRGVDCDSALALYIRAKCQVALPLLVSADLSSTVRERAMFGGALYFGKFGR
jgi:hypothetical protein